MPYKNPASQKEYARKHYRQNKAKYLSSNNQRRKILKQKIREMKSSNPCADCNISYPYYVMDFDHLNDKESLIAVFVNNNNKTGLEKELAKCEIVCSNCHRIRSYRRMQKI